MGQRPCALPVEELLNRKEELITITGTDQRLEQAVCSRCQFPVGQHGDMGGTGCSLSQEQLSEHREWMISVTTFSNQQSVITCTSCRMAVTAHSSQNVEGHVLL